MIKVGKTITLDEAYDIGDTLDNKITPHAITRMFDNPELIDKCQRLNSNDKKAIIKAYEEHEN